MATKTISLRCYAKQESKGVWVAVCIDLNLAAQAESIDQAKAQLHHQIESYCAGLRKLNPKQRRDLFPRRAPLSLCIPYYRAAVFQFAADLLGRARPKRIAQFRENTYAPC